MKKSRAVEVLAFCMVAISLFSCTSIDKSDLSSVLGENRMAFELLPTSNDAAVTTLVPRFVFPNSDKRSLTIMADTLGPQYHLTLIAENVKTCSDIIDVAYLNGLEVELKYTKKNHEVSSVRLLCGKTRDSSPILTTEWVSALKTNIPTAKWRNIRIVGHHWMDKSKAKLIIQPMFPYDMILWGNTPNFEQCLHIIEFAENNHLRVDLLFVGDTYEIVALRLSNAVEQTGWKIVGTRFYRTRTQPKECSVLTEEELQRVFSRIVANSCDKDNRPDRYPCIPFGYATDGCLARAHAMRRLINSLGYECHKAFMRYGLICKKYAHSSSLAENGWAYIMVRLQHYDAAGQRHGVAVDFEREVGVVVSEVSDKEPEVLLHEFRLQLAVDGYALERLAVGKRRFTDFRDVG